MKIHMIGTGPASPSRRAALGALLAGVATAGAWTSASAAAALQAAGAAATGTAGLTKPELKIRSEERRVGKECRSRWSPYH